MLNCKECPFYDEGDFTPEGEEYCRGILDFGYCPFGKDYKKEVVN